ncbi:hypothetical protein Trisim1_010680 [Trichoderma cf. simile WF8]
MGPVQQVPILSVHELAISVPILSPSRVVSLSCEKKKAKPARFGISRPLPVQDQHPIDKSTLQNLTRPVQYETQFTIKYLGRLTAP